MVNSLESSLSPARGCPEILMHIKSSVDSSKQWLGSPYAISLSQPLPPVVALLSRISKSQIAAKSRLNALHFGTQSAKLHWPLSFGAANRSVLNRSVFKTQTQLHRTFYNRGVLAPLRKLPKS